MQALSRKETQFKQVIYLTLRIAWQKQPNNYSEVTPMMRMYLISVHILDPFRKLQLFKKLDKGFDTSLENKTSYTTY